MVVLAFRVVMLVFQVVFGVTGLVVWVVFRVVGVGYCGGLICKKKIKTKPIKVLLEKKKKMVANKSHVEVKD